MRILSKPCWLIIVSIVLALPVRGAEPRTVQVDTREALIAAVASAAPGTTIQIAPGTYRGGLDLTGLRGGPGQPIVLAAQEPEQPPVFQGGGSGFHVSGASHLELRGLILSGATGNGLNIDDGGSRQLGSNHIVLRDLQIRDVGPDGNRDGIKLSGVDQFLVDGCTIERWGSGGSAIDMVGCHQGEVSNCTFRYLSDVAANGVQTKGGSSLVTIRRCRFENAGSRAVNIGGSTGRDYFRPPSVDYEAKQITVEDCIFIGSMAPLAFVGCDGATVRYNTIFRPTRWVARILQESQGAEFVPCRNGEFLHNVIAFRADEVQTIVNVGGGTAPQTFRFAGNHWYCIDQPSRSDRLNLPVAETAGSYGQDPQFADAEALDLRVLDRAVAGRAGVRGTGPSRP
jgi:hypothetical protein